MKSKLKNVSIMFNLVSMLILGFILYSPSNIDESVNSDLLQKIESEIDVTISGATLSSAEEATKFINKLMSKLFIEGKLSSSPFGVVKNPNSYNLPETQITIFVDSSGGSVELLFNLTEAVESIKDLNIHIECIIANASSATFTLVQSICDTRLLLSKGKLIQHKTYYPIEGLFKSYKYFDSNSTLLSIKMSNIEAARIGKNASEWYKISRENGDKYFTEEEALKYKLIDGIIK